MRKLTVVIVAAMILLAGCGGGGGGAASPTEESGTDAPASGTPMENAAMDNGSMDTGSESGTTSPLSSAANGDALSNATEVDVTLYNGTDQTSVLVRNDTAAGRELVELSQPAGTTTVYSTSDYVAVQNSTTGDVQYGEVDGRVGTGTKFAAGFTAIAGFIYVGFVEWEQSGTTMVDGESATVYEGDSLNETAFDNQNLQLAFQQSDVQSVDGRVVVGPDGQVHSVSVQLETADGTYGTEMSLGYDDISVSQPSWVDESQAPN